MTNREDLSVEVDGIPLQPADLTSAQAVERCEYDRQFKERTFYDFKELLQFLAVVRIYLKTILAWTLHLVCRVRRDQIHLIRILQCFPNVRMTVDDRTVTRM